MQISRPVIIGIVIGTFLTMLNSGCAAKSPQPQITDTWTAAARRADTAAERAETAANRAEEAAARVETAAKRTEDAAARVEAMVDKTMMK